MPDADAILFEHNVHREALLAALDIVRDFLRDRGRVLVGGMTIDLALKMRARPGIYDVTEIPDYAALSPMHYSDACELAVRLCEFYRGPGNGPRDARRPRNSRAASARAVSIRINRTNQTNRTRQNSQIASTTRTNQTRTKPPRPAA